MSKAEGHRGQSRAELEAKIQQLHEEIFNLRFRNRMKQLESPVQMREKRREIARILTVLNEEKQGKSKSGSVRG